MKKLIIFGIGKTADVAYHYISSDSERTVTAFTCDPEYIDQDVFNGLPVIPFDEVAVKYPSSDYDMHVAIGYHDINRARGKKYLEVKEHGYSLYSYISSSCYCANNATVGDNALILDGVVIQPGVSIGNNCYIWSNTVVGHHSHIGDHCWLAAQTSIAGATDIGTHCFFGMNTTIGNEINIGNYCFIGAGAVVTKNINDKGVHICQDTPRFQLDIDHFLQLSKLK